MLLHISFPLSQIPSIWMSLLILLVLSVIFAGSWIVFWMLALRSTAARYSVSLREWGDTHSMKFRRASADKLPAPLDAVSTQRLIIRFCLGGKKSTLIQFK